MKYKFIAIIFGVILLLPLTAGVAGWGNEIYLNDNRPLTEWPRFRWSKDYLTDLNNYYSDNFGLRKLMVVCGRWLKLKLLTTSPAKTVIFGKNNWLFYTADTNFIDTINGQPFSEGDLKTIKTNLEEIHSRLKKQGVNFYFVVAPNKQSIYPEFLPSYAKKVRPESRLDQISAYLTKNSQINFINPKDKLWEAKKTELVYLKNDSHWNDAGAWTAYREISKRLSEDYPKIEVLTEAELTTVEKTAKSQDLVEVQIGVEGFNKEKEATLTVVKPSAKQITGGCEEVYKTCSEMSWESDNKKLPTMVMFRDSFGIKLIPFLAQNFRRSDYFWGPIPYSWSIIDERKPNVVIMELTERELWRLKEPLFK